jgi:uncharacterized SAM-binding protein YcdF (DUF218 family)
MIDFAGKLLVATHHDVPESSGRSERFFGILTRKERWGLSWRAWLMLGLVGFIGAIFLVLNIQPFLAETHPVNSNLLVVEGWVHEYATRVAAEEFRNGSYQRVFTTGGPEEGTGGYVNDYQTEASVGADLLRKDGIPNDLVQMVPSRVKDRDRTYGSAIAFRNWLHEHNFSLRSVNVLTEDVHARRTRLLFQKALGDNVKVGIISVPSPDYDAKHWWRYSQGVKDVVVETLGYVYAKLIFRPSKSASATNLTAPPEN